MVPEYHGSQGVGVERHGRLESLGLRDDHTPGGEKEHYYSLTYPLLNNTSVLWEPGSWSRATWPSGVSGAEG